VDSESSNSFLGAKLSPLLAGVSALSKPVNVQVANGQVIQCSSKIRNAHWFIQYHEFVTDLKLLHLPYYDLILGIDWLAMHSPMRVDWHNKWMTVT
jgi:hypothetical protein